MSLARTMRRAAERRAYAAGHRQMQADGDPGLLISKRQARGTAFDKGWFRGSCNTTACQRPGAEWFNHSTRAYYCEDCAHVLNRVNADAVELFGHPLCIKGQHHG